MTASGPAPARGATGKKTGALLGLPALSSVLLPDGPERGIWAQEVSSRSSTASTAAAAAPGLRDVPFTSLVPARVRRPRPARQPWLRRLRLCSPDGAFDVRRRRRFQGAAWCPARVPGSPTSAGSSWSGDLVMASPCFSGKGQPEIGSRSLVAPRLEPAVVEFGVLRGDGQAQPAAAGGARPGGVGAPEPVEDPRRFGLASCRCRGPGRQPPRRYRWRPRRC